MCQKMLENWPHFYTYRMLTLAGETVADRNKQEKERTENEWIKRRFDLFTRNQARFWKKLEDTVNVQRFLRKGNCEN
jgi:hypothetical protein